MFYFLDTDFHDADHDAKLKRVQIDNWKIKCLGLCKQTLFRFVNEIR